MKDEKFILSVADAMKIVENNVVNRITADMIRRFSDIQIQLSDMQNQLSRIQKQLSDR